MGRSELLVTKPGALTCTEAMLMKLPMVLVNTLPGQERVNAAYLMGLGCADEAKPEELAEKVKFILHDKSKREAMKDACRLVSPYSAKAVVKVLYDMVKTGDQ